MRFIARFQPPDKTVSVSDCPIIVLFVSNISIDCIRQRKKKKEVLAKIDKKKL